jgi:hypothetical protein
MDENYHIIGFDFWEIYFWGGENNTVTDFLKSGIQHIIGGECTKYSSHCGKEYGCSTTVSKFGWRLFAGNTHCCLFLLEFKMVYLWFCGTGVYVLFSVLFLSGVAGSFPVCEFEPPSSKNCLN